MPGGQAHSRQHAPLRSRCRNVQYRLATRLSAVATIAATATAPS